MIKTKKHVLYLRICPCCHNAAAAAKSLQSCPTLGDPIDGSCHDKYPPFVLEHCILTGRHVLLWCIIFLMLESSTFLELLIILPCLFNFKCNSNLHFYNQGSDGDFKPLGYAHILR